MTPPSESRMTVGVGLEACPFCGGEAALISMKGDPKHPTEKLDLQRPQCMACGADLGGFRTKAEAIAAWNRRAAPRTPSVERLLEIEEAADAVWCDQAAGINNGKAMERLRVALGREIAP